MNVFICVLGVESWCLEWNFPLLPRIGEHMFIADFVPEIPLKADIDDVLKIVDIQWIKLNGEICPTLFLGDEYSEIPDIKSFRLN